MGLFSENSITPRAFYADCVEAFHREAQRRGVAGKGVITVPELTATGKKTVRAFLNNPTYQRMCSCEAEVYYPLILSLCLEAGLVQAAAWSDESGNLARSADECIAGGPSARAADLLREHFPREISDDHGYRFSHAIYAVCEEKLRPFWAKRDPSRYVYRAMLAAHALGVSMMLDRCGKR